jgi:ribose 5-phosphate isomerase B
MDQGTFLVKRIALGTDHAGFHAKEAIKIWLAAQGCEVIDCGADSLEPEDDYPIFIAKAAQTVQAGMADSAIIFGGSGQGEAMMANRYQGIRAVVYYGGPREIITLSRQHNGANVLSFGARFVSLTDMEEVITEWLTTPVFLEPKYERRAFAMDTLSTTQNNLS